MVIEFIACNHATSHMALSSHDESILAELC
jgi:hypothetical protein